MPLKLQPKKASELGIKLTFPVPLPSKVIFQQ